MHFWAYVSCCMPQPRRFASHHIWHLQYESYSSQRLTDHRYSFSNFSNQNRLLNNYKKELSSRRYFKSVFIIHRIIGKLYLTTAEFVRTVWETKLFVVVVATRLDTDRGDHKKNLRLLQDSNPWPTAWYENTLTLCY